MGQDPRHVARILAAPLVLAGVAGCGRAPDAPWVVTEEAPPLARNLVPVPPTRVFWSPQRLLAEGAEQTFSVRVTRSVRQRGPGVPTIPLSVEEDLVLARRVTDHTDRSVTLRVTMLEAEVTVDPPVEALAEDLRQSRLGTALRVTLDGTGRVEKASRAPRQGGGSTGLDGPSRDVVGLLKRLWPVTPGHPVQVGDGWRFLVSAQRPVPGGEAQETLDGRYHFLGMVPRDAGTADSEEGAAVVSLDYDITLTGPGRGTPRMSGTGVGRGVFLLDPDTADLLRGEVVESTHVLVEWPSRRKPRRVEQWARVLYEIAAPEGTP